LNHDGIAEQLLDRGADSNRLPDGVSLVELAPSEGRRELLVKYGAK